MRFAVVLVCLLGCSPPGEPVRDWTLIADATTPVTLPGNFFSILPHRELDYSLRTTIAAIPDDHPTTLVVPCFHGDLHLLVDGNPAPDTILMRGGSCIVGPLGEILAEPRFNEEAILTAEIDPGQIASGKYDFDVIGHYARPDVFQLSVNEHIQSAVRTNEAPVVRYPRAD